MGNIVNTIKRFSNSDATATPVQSCSNLSIGTPRFDKCTCIDNGISATGEAASASKGGSLNAYQDVCEVANERMLMAPGSTSTKGCLGDINLFTLPMVHTKPSGTGNDKADKEREAPNGTFHTDARGFGRVDHSEKTAFICSQAAGHMFHSLEDESAEAPRSIMLDISKNSLSDVSPKGNSFRNTNLADDVLNSPAADPHRGKELILLRVSPADGLFDCNVCEESADVALDSGYNSSVEVSFEGQRHEKRTHDKLLNLNYDVVPIEAIKACSNLDVIGSKSKTKSSLKGRAKRRRTTSSQMFVPKENVGTLVPLDLVCLENEEQPTGPLMEQSSGDKVLQRTPRLRRIKTPLSYVYQSPLTRSRGKALSISTPESVKMKRSKSGRLIVPRLDPGSQNITYGWDGSICGVTNLEAQFPQGISSEPPSKRRSRRLSPVHNRMLTF